MPVLSHENWCKIGLGDTGAHKIIRTLTYWSTDVRFCNLAEHIVVVKVWPSPNRGANIKVASRSGHALSGETGRADGPATSMLFMGIHMGVFSNL